MKTKYKRNSSRPKGGDIKKPIEIEDIKFEKPIGGI
jgi:hypothetical protein